MMMMMMMMMMTIMMLTMFRLRLANLPMASQNKADMPPGHHGVRKMSN